MAFLIRFRVFKCGSRCSWWNFWWTFFK